MLHFVEWEVVTDVSKVLRVFISTVSCTKEQLSAGYEGSAILRNVDISLRYDTA